MSPQSSGALTTLLGVNDQEQEFRRAVAHDPELRKLARKAIDKAKRDRIERTGSARGHAALDRMLGIKPPSASSRTRMTTPLSEQELLAVARSLDDGMTLREVAMSIWAKHGYASADSCYTSLMQRLKHRRLIPS